MKNVVSYYRTSSQANVGDDKDSKKRQEASCDLYAKRNKSIVVNTFYDAGVSGKTNALDRPEFKRMIFWCEDNNVSTNTPTKKAWGGKQKRLPGVIRYTYRRKYPHHGIGKWILF